MVRLPPQPGQRDHGSHARRLRCPLPDVIYDERLIEISFGKFEGLLHEEIAREREALAPGQRDATYWNFRPEGGENYQDLADRLLDFAQGLTHHSIIVAHGGVLRVLRHLVEGVARGEVLNWARPRASSPISPPAG
ncbi:histidine phosphatase family protein [Pelagibacterium sp.]|uniref:histidine phosphatase family protein n=1 Tax=Pelagibacterium sp. TaxID=1967288 RepID=UPI003BAB070B